MADKKLDFDDLDLSEIGSVIKDDSVEDEIVETIKETKPLSGYRLFSQPIEDGNSGDMAVWISGLLPATEPNGFKPTAFDTVNKRQVAMDKVISIHSSLQLIFPVKERPKEYKN